MRTSTRVIVFSLAAGSLLSACGSGSHRRCQLSDDDLDVSDVSDVWRPTPDGHAISRTELPRNGESRGDRILAR